MPCDSLSDNRRAGWALKIVSGLLALGREALFHELEPEGPQACWIPRGGNCFQFSEARMAPLASNRGLQLGMPTRCLEFRLPFPYYLKHTGTGTIPFSSNVPTRMPYLTSSDPDRSYWQANSQSLP